LKTKTNPAVFQKALNLLKFANEKDLHFQDLALTIRKIKIEVARDLVR
jgi:FMN phosphatase YigB (HAD superfamily)